MARQLAPKWLKAPSMFKPVPSADAIHSTPPRPCCIVFDRGVKLGNKRAT
jgi:hypothetical protein